MLLTMDAFSGVMPRINEQQLPLGAAVEAEGFKTDSGCIEPYKKYGSPIRTVEGCTCFVVWPTSEDRVWPPGNDDAYISFSKDIDYCYGAALGFDVLIYTGDEFPKYTYPKTGYTCKLGVTAPTSEPYAYDGVSKWIQVTPFSICVPVKHVFETNLDPVEIEGKEHGLTTISYCYTCIDADGQESAPSKNSAFYEVVDFVHGQGIRLAGFLNIDPTNNAISKYRIYRCQGGTGSEAEFLYIGELPNGGENIFDDYDIENHTFRIAAEAVKTEGWSPPPVTLKGITNLSGGVLAGFIKNSNTLCFSEPLIQYAWPEKYQIKTPQPILNITSLGDELVIFMASMVMTARGEPGAFSLASVYGGKGTPCITNKGFVKTEAGLIFPGHDGLYLYNGSICTNLTYSAMTTVQWRSLLPDKFMSVYYDGRYWAFRQDFNKVVTIDINNGSLVYIDISDISPVAGLHIDYLGRFFILSGNKAYKWSEGLDIQNAIWKSGVITFKAPVNLSSAIIISDTPTDEDLIQLKIWSHYNGVATLVLDSKNPDNEIVIPLNKPFRLPSGFMTSSIQVQVFTKVAIREIKLATSMTELSG